MPSSEAELCNMALSHLGVEHEIGDLDSDREVEARVCRKFYETCRDQTLGDYQWNFAETRVDLAVVEEDPNDDWAYSYRWPSDCLMPIRISCGDRNAARDDRTVYTVGSDTTGRLIYTDMEDAELVYIKRVTSVSLFPPDFCMALSLRLAAAIAPQLTGGDPFKLGIQALTKYRMEISMASAKDANAEEADQPPEAEWIRGR